MQSFSTSANAKLAGRFRNLFKFGNFFAAIAVAGLCAASAANAAMPPAPAKAVGGPFETAKKNDGDPQFRALFLSWKQLDGAGPAGRMSVPSMQPVANLSFSSFFGVRSDPFRGTAAMHAGVDIPGPIGTPIYATADGVVERTGWTGGYGNLVELDHGRGLQTRYGHLSKILVSPGAHVKRGDLIALMGSTGRSTGSHLHYEVRLDGHAVNPIPFLDSVQSAQLAQAKASAMTAPLAQGGPEDDAGTY